MRAYDGIRGRTKSPQRRPSAPCKRPYELGKRLELSDGKRIAILQSARKQLESNGFLQLTMESLAKESGVTRQTIHNLFGTKSAVLETLFDQLAVGGGLERMREVMQQPNPEIMLLAFVEVFTGFWTKDRMLIRRIHGIAAIDPEFGEVVAARNKRRQMAAFRVVDRLEQKRRFLQRSGSGATGRNVICAHVFRIFRRPGGKHRQHHCSGQSCLRPCKKIHARLTAIFRPSIGRRLSYIVRMPSPNVNYATYPELVMIPASGIVTISKHPPGT